MRKEIFTIGDLVKLKGFKKTTRIEIFYRDIEGGVRLNKKLRGYYSWNLEDLEKVKERR